MGTVVDDIMTKTICSIGPEATIEAARALMTEKHVRHLLILEKGAGKLLGMLSDRDIKKFLSPFAGSPAATDRDNATLSIKVEKVMVKPVLTVKAGSDVKSLVEKMLQKKIGAMPIMSLDESRIVGIITTIDLLKLLYGRL